MQIYKNDNYKELLENIGNVFSQARQNAVQSVNRELVKAYWETGRHIVEYEQNGSIKAEYGKSLLENISRDLKIQYGKGFSRSNLTYMRLFYIKFPICETASRKLSWSHYFELLKISDDLARGFYEKQCINENWSVRELKRNVDSALFQRLALSRDKEGVLDLSKKGHIANKPEDLVKDPYILEFLNIPQSYKLSEKHLEQKIIDNLQTFLMELGKGFTFVSRQYRITLANTHYYVDLVFYHRILKCFVLIDLKINEVKHHDIGQMNMYLNYFKTEENVADDNEPVGIILSADKDDILVEYATGGLSNKLFVSKYQLYLPDRKLLEDRLKMLLG